MKEKSVEGENSHNWNVDDHFLELERSGLQYCFVDPKHPRQDMRSRKKLDVSPVREK